MALLPKVKLKALVSFPATVLDGMGIDVTKQNGNYKIDLAFDDFAPPVMGIPDPPHTAALLWNSLTGQYLLTPISLFGGPGGIAEAPNDGVQYGRQSTNWTPIPTITTPSNTNPLMDGIAAPGALGTFSRGDHIHPIDTSRAPLASPLFTGDPRAPTPTAGDNDTSIATTAFVGAAVSTALVPFAPLASPLFTGDPRAPTPAPGDNDTSIATTAFVGAAITTAATNFQPIDGDLTAIAALSGTGLARRTAANTWTLGTAVVNAELATMAAFTFKGNNTNGIATPTDVDIAALAAKASPAGGDFLLLSDQAAFGAWKKIAISSLPGSSGGIPEAPNDGIQYGRQSLGWTPITGGGVANISLSNLSAVAINTALLPGVTDSIALGSSTKTWSDLFLGPGGQVNWNSGAVAITEASGALTVNGVVNISGKLTVGGGVNITAPGAGITALQVAGIGGAGLNIDYGGAGNTYYDATTHVFRSGVGAGNQTWANITAGSLGLVGGGASGYNQTILTNDLGNTYQIGFGGSTSAFPNKFFIYANVLGGVLTADAAGTFSFLANVTSTSTTTGTLVVAGGVGIAGTVTANYFQSGLNSNMRFELMGQAGNAMSFTKGYGDVALGQHTFILFQGVGSIAAHNSFWNGIQFGGPIITESGVTNYPRLAFYATAATVTDPTDYSWNFQSGGGADTSQSINFYSRTVAAQAAEGQGAINFSTSAAALRIGRSGAVSLFSTTASTSITTGALTVAGGVGISGSLNVGGLITSTSSGSAIAIGNNSISSTGVGNTIQMQYGSAQNIVMWNGGGTGQLLILSPTASTSTTTGALQVAGGVGIGGTLNIGGAFNSTGYISVGAGGPNDAPVTTNVTAANGIAIHLFGTSPFFQYTNSGVKDWAFGCNGTSLAIFEDRNIAAVGTERFRFAAGGNFSILTNIVSTSPTTGSLVVVGGVGIGGDTFVGGFISSTAGFLRVTGDFSKTSDTVLADVPGLSANLAAGVTYGFDITLYCTDAAAGGIKVALIGTATVTDLRGASFYHDGAATIAGYVQFSTLTTIANAATTGTTPTVKITGTFTVLAAGNLRVQFAQSVSNATASVVKRGSTMRVFISP